MFNYRISQIAGIVRGPASPLGQNGWLRGRIRRELAGDDVCRPYPRQMALVEKDFLQLSEEGRTWLSTVMASSLM